MTFGPTRALEGVIGGTHAAPHSTAQHSWTGERQHFGHHWVKLPDMGGGVSGGDMHWHED